MLKDFCVNQRRVGLDATPYLVAEVSGNHQKDIRSAKKIIEVFAESGAHAVKFQTYTPDTLTLSVRNKYFKKKESYWDGCYLYDLYAEGMTPWEWFPELDAHAKQCGVDFFSTPFDETAVDFLEEHVDPPVYKIASYELIHLPLLEKIGKTGKPVILSTGMGSESEIREAIHVLKNTGTPNILLLKCISAYPINPHDYHLKTIPTLREKFSCHVGLSDHYLGNEAALGAIALGACLIEKHVTLDRSYDSIDRRFSLNPDEFKQLAQSTELLHKALGESKLGPTEQEKVEVTQRRSIFVAHSIGKDEIFTKENLKIVRPGDGLSPNRWKDVLGKKARHSIAKGEPLCVGDWIE